MGEEMRALTEGKELTLQQTPNQSSPIPGTEEERGAVLENFSKRIQVTTGVITDGHSICINNSGFLKNHVGVETCRTVIRAGKAAGISLLCFT